MLAFIFLGSLNVCLASVIISEIELNPNDTCNDCSEWVEFYSSAQTDLTNWYISDASGKNQTLNLNIEGYYILQNLTISLNNANEQLFIYDSMNNLIFNTSIISDSLNNNQTWQYCSGEWIFTNSTRGIVNNCQIQNSNNTSNQTNNNSTSNTNTSENDSLYLKLDWDDEDIVSNKEFIVVVKAFNLANEDYDVKIFIEDEDGTIVSETYNEPEGAWQSGNYYIEDCLQGEGEDQQSIKLRLKQDNLSGDFKIGAKIRIYGASSIVADITKDIEVILNNLTLTEENLSFQNHTSNSNVEVIRLNSKSTSKNNKTLTANSIVYKSKNEYIREYAPYAFGMLCIILTIVLILNLDQNKNV